MKKFLEKLRQELRKRPFDAASARSLSLEIHEAESADLTLQEDILWQRLTDRLECVEPA